jgi:hypothetical protein
LCSEAAKLKAVHRVSFADAFVAATAKRVDAVLIHKGPEFAALAHQTPAVAAKNRNERKINDVTDGDAIPRARATDCRL